MDYIICFKANTLLAIVIFYVRKLNTNNIYSNKVGNTMVPNNRIDNMNLRINSIRCESNLSLLKRENEKNGTLYTESKNKTSKEYIQANQPFSELQTDYDLITKIPGYIRLVKPAYYSYYYKDYIPVYKINHSIIDIIWEYKNYIKLPKQLSIILTRNSDSGVIIYNITNNLPINNTRYLFDTRNYVNQNKYLAYNYPLVESDYYLHIFDSSLEYYLSGKPGQLNPFKGRIRLIGAKNSENLVCTECLKSSIDNASLLDSTKHKRFFGLLFLLILICY